MKTLLVERDIDWLPKPNEAHCVQADVLPPSHLITSAFGLLFDGDRVLMSRLVRRGWDIPGGHIEPGETPLETMQREVYEETRVRPGTVALLGYQKILIHGAKPPGYRYPYPVSYQVVFWGQVAAQEPFAPTGEVTERGLFLPAEARQILHGEVAILTLYEAALAAATGKGKCAP